MKFFGTRLATELARDGKQADLLVGNNVLAQVPDLCDFVAGMKILLKPQGVLTLEFPHLLRLMEENQFDTIYHEHFSYFSFLTVEKIFAAYGLVLFDVEELPTHGGSLRIFGRHQEDAPSRSLPGLIELRAREEAAGLHAASRVTFFRRESEENQTRELLQCLIRLKQEGKSIVGYGAPGKGQYIIELLRNRKRLP